MFGINLVLDSGLGLGFEFLFRMPVILDPLFLARFCVLLL